MQQNDLQQRLDHMLFCTRMLYGIEAEQDPQAAQMWSEANHAYRYLTAAIDGQSTDRLFVRSDGRNPWGYPEGLGERILWCLNSMGIRQVGWMRNSAILETKSQYIGDFWFLGDNGGELTCFKLNDKETMSLPGIACTGGYFAGMRAHPMRWAMTVAGWIADRITKGEVDHSRRFGDGGEPIPEHMEIRFLGK